MPGRVRIDRGKDFLSTTVGAVMAEFAIKVVGLPPYTPHLKGTVETVNGAANHMFFAGLPRARPPARLTGDTPARRRWRTAARPTPTRRR